MKKFLIGLLPDRLHFGLSAITVGLYHGAGQWAALTFFGVWLVASSFPWMARARTPVHRLCDHCGGKLGDESMEKYGRYFCSTFCHQLSEHFP
jgi:hypothetical protein